MPYPVLDVGIDYGTAGGPGFSTDIVTSASAFEKRTSRNLYPRGRWQLGERLVDETMLQYLHSFFVAMEGRFGTFRFKDWGDYTADKSGVVSRGAVQQGIGQYVDANTAMLMKKYTVSGVETKRRIFFPIASSVVVEVNGSPASITVNDETGLVTFGSPIANTDVITASFEFHCPARFDSDEFVASFENMENGYKVFFLQSLPVKEVLPY